MALNNGVASPMEFALVVEDVQGDQGCGGQTLKLRLLLTSNHILIAILNQNVEREWLVAGIYG